MRIRESGKQKRATVCSLKQPYFGEEKMMRFIRGEVVSYRLKIRLKTTNVAEINEEKVEGDVKTFWVATERAVRPVLFSERDSEAGLESPF
ncbi:hypothetical protein E2C01_027049 [Portunus trituberculatus]|uniref:Uncharacterized protein n=1 Tax=Portunus trituberculatus TaxID=210409 RepID=A0A5B7EGW7_PORTR|nr:hypothetical protein [Portunus trituberculatus]